MRAFLLAVCACILLISSLPAWATLFSFSPSDPDLADLPHASYYIWGVKWTLPAGEEIAAAKITYLNIYDTENSDDDVLYTHLLDTVADPNGTVNSPNYAWDPAHTYQRITISGSDADGGSDQFAGQGLKIGEWTDPEDATKAIDLSYDIPSSHFPWMTDGNFGFGIDPDCHYNNCGIVVCVTTRQKEQVIPEPISALLGSLGLVAVSGARKLRKK